KVVVAGQIHPPENKPSVSLVPFKLADVNAVPKQIRQCEGQSCLLLKHNTPPLSQAHC
ncbi:Uncharacterized protein DAT39_003133, partial [Clarias magur]